MHRSGTQNDSSNSTVKQSANQPSTNLVIVSQPVKNHLNLDPDSDEIEQLIPCKIYSKDVDFKALPIEDHKLHVRYDIVKKLNVDVRLHNDSMIACQSLKSAKN